MYTMKQLFDADMENIEADYESLMKAEAEQRTAFEEAHEAKMKLLGEQREGAIARTKARYGIGEPVPELKAAPFPS